MRRILRYAAAVVGVLAIGGLSLEFVAWILLEGFERWPTRSELQATLDPPAASSTRELRLDDPNLPMLRDFVLHPYLGFVRNYERLRHELNRNVIELPVNDLGFIGELPPTHASEQRLIVGLTGGSVASELFLFSRDALRRALAAQPRFAGRDIQVVSFALGGMKQPQQLMALSWLLTLGYHFDLVVNLDGFNEVALTLGDNVRLGVFPAYPRNWRGYSARAFDDQALWYAGRLELNARSIESWRTTFSRAPLRQSSAALLLWNQLLRVRSAQRAALELGLRQQLSHSKALDAQTRGPRSSSLSLDRGVGGSVAIWKRASLQLARLCLANGIDYWQFLQPNLYFAGTKPLSDWEAAEVAQATADGYRYGLGAARGYPLLESAGAELIAEGVAFVDLSRAFAGIPETMYRDSCCHYTREGYDRIARDIADAVGGEVHAR